MLSNSGRRSQNRRGPRERGDNAYRCPLLTALPSQIAVFRRTLVEFEPICRMLTGDEYYVLQIIDLIEAQSYPDYRKRQLH